VRLISIGLAAALAVLLAGCSSSSDAGSPSGRRAGAGPTELPIRSCAQVACTGQIAGARYQLRLPQRWNGTLLLYSHGYRPAEPAPPDDEPVETEAQVATTDAVATRLLAHGYALAGSAYRSNGWAVADGVSAGEQLHQLFVDTVGKPARTYVWGDSLGGLITEILAERHPDWVTGAAPLCGVLGGGNLNFDIALDVAYAIKTLIYPQLRLVGYRSFGTASRQFQQAYRAVLAAVRSGRDGVGKVLLIAALVDAPRKTGRFDGNTLQSQLSALVEGLVTALVFSTMGRQELERRVGGNPSGNATTDYAARISPAERSLIEGVAPGTVAANLGRLAAGQRVSPEPLARAALDRLGIATGQLRVPTLTLHTVYDPLVLVQNETVFRDRVRQAGQSDRLRQLYSAPPASYPTAPYGAGHCRFSTAERVGVITLLDTWVRDGTVPGPAAARATIGKDTGIAGYTPGPWPAATG
jgi:pimeloyl-ACP methyl ester carboxylesterase